MHKEKKFIYIFTSNWDQSNIWFICRDSK